MVSPFRERAEQAHAFPWKNHAPRDPRGSLAFANACEKRTQPCSFEVEFLPPVVPAVGKRADAFAIRAWLRERVSLDVRGRAP